MLQQSFLEVIQLIRQGRNTATSIVNTELVNLYWQVGEYISKKVAAASWGDKTVQALAEYIERSHPDLKGFNRRGLYRMKQFYECYSSMKVIVPAVQKLQLPVNQQEGIVPSVMAQLEVSDIRNTKLAKISWTHHLILLSRIKTEEEREFYLHLCIQEKYTVRELERQINSGVFERVILSGQKLSPAVKELYKDISHSIKDSYIFEFLNLPEPYGETDLQKALISQMKNFILELGKDFLFMGQEHQLQVGSSDFFIDLLFYHRGLQCLVAFELKADKFRPEYLGQLNFYLEALDRDVKRVNENPSIGILLCKDKDVEVVEYALSRNLSSTLVADYQTQLPDKKILQQKLRELFR